MTAPQSPLRTLRTTALSVGIQGPVAGVIVGPAILASLVGSAGALAYLLGFVAMAFVAYAFVVFSRSFHSSGSVYAFNTVALGPTYGFVSAWILLLVYLSFAAAVYASTADIAQNLFANWGLHLAWPVVALAGFALTMVFAHRSVRVATGVILVVEGLAIVLVAVVALAIIAKNGVAHALSPAPFELHGVAFGALALGVVNAFGAFSGFEGAATLGEESLEPRRTIPKAIAFSLVGSSLVYIVFTWIVDNAFASSQALAKSPAPVVHLASVYVGSWMGDVVNVAGVMSAFGAQLACVVAANRLISALGQDVVAPSSSLHRFVTARHPRFGSPSGALVISGSVTLAALLAFSGEASAIRALTLIVEFGAYLIILAYFMTVVAALVWLVRTRGHWASALVLGVGVVVLGVVVFDTFHPFPPAPFNWVVGVAGASVLVGVVIARTRSVRGRFASSPLLSRVRSNSPAPVEV